MAIKTVKPHEAYTAAHEAKRKRTAKVTYIAILSCRHRFLTELLVSLSIGAGSGHRVSLLRLSGLSD